MIYDPRLLIGLKICHGMTSLQLDAFIDACLPARVPAGTLLMSRGDDDRAMLFVREGEVEVFVGSGSDEIVVGELGPGQHAGAMGLLRLAERRTASARARTACTLLLLEPEGLQVLERKANPIVYNLEADLIKGLIARQSGVLQSLARLASGQEPRALWQGPGDTMLDRFGNLLGLRHAAGNLTFSAVDALRACPGMTEASEALLLSLYERLTPQRLEPGTVLTREGGARTDAFIVVRGSIGRFKGCRGRGLVPLGVLHPGALGGFECMLEMHSPPVTSVALQESIVLRVPRSLCVDALFERSAMSRLMRRAMLKSLGLRLDEAIGALLETVHVSTASNNAVALDQDQMLQVAGNASAGMF